MWSYVGRIRSVIQIPVVESMGVNFCTKKMYYSGWKVLDFSEKMMRCKYSALRDRVTRLWEDPEKACPDSKFETLSKVLTPFGEDRTQYMTSAVPWLMEAPECATQIMRPTRKHALGWTMWHTRLNLHYAVELSGPDATYTIRKGPWWKQPLALGNLDYLSTTIQEKYVLFARSLLV